MADEYGNYMALQPKFWLAGDERSPGAVDATALTFE
jgi:hypothetical protein